MSEGSINALSQSSHKTSGALSIQINPFWNLGATTRDTAQRIIALADERSLQLDYDACQKAQSDLTNPRTRLAAEMAWLPGISPGRAKELVTLIAEDPPKIFDYPGLPPLATANLMASLFETLDSNLSSQTASGLILGFARVVELIDAESVFRDINEERSVSGFPAVKGWDSVESELGERRRRYTNAVKQALDRLPSTVLVDVITEVIATDTNRGEGQGTVFLNDLVDAYEVEAKGHLEGEAEKAFALIESIRAVASHGEAAVAPLILKLEQVVRGWSIVAQPIHLSMKSRGMQHGLSHRMAFSIRGLGVDLFKEHGMLDQSQRITGMLKEHFAELPELAERIVEDVEAIQSIFESRKLAEQQRQEWEREITYRASIGLVFKDTLAISPAGVEWKGRAYPLASITRVRWGGVRHSINGIPTGTTFTIGIGDNSSEAVIGMRDKEIFSTFTDKLWRAVCVRLMAETLEALRSGRQLSFGDAVIADNGVTLTKRKFFSGNERVFRDWFQTHVWSADGSFYIGSKEDKKCSAALSYIYTPNTHLLEESHQNGFQERT